MTTLHFFFWHVFDPICLCSSYFFVIFLGCVLMFFGKPVRSHERHYYVRKKTSQQTVFLLPMIPIYTKYVLSLVRYSFSCYYLCSLCLFFPVLWEKYIMFCIPYDFVQKVQSMKYTILLLFPLFSLIIISGLHTT